MSHLKAQWHQHSPDTSHPQEHRKEVMWGLRHNDKETNYMSTVLAVWKCIWLLWACSAVDLFIRRKLLLVSCKLCMSEAEEREGDFAQFHWKWHISGEMNGKIWKEKQQWWSTRAIKPLSQDSWTWAVRLDSTSGGHNKNSYASPGPELLLMSQSLSSFSSVTTSQWLLVSQGSNSCSGVWRAEFWCFISLSLSACIHVCTALTSNAGRLGACAFSSHKWHQIHTAHSTITALNEAHISSPRQSKLLLKYHTILIN